MDTGTNACSYITSIYPRIKFLWPVQPFHKVLFVWSCATSLQYLSILIVSSSLPSTFCTLFVHWNTVPQKTTMHNENFTRPVLIVFPLKMEDIFEIRTLSPTLNLHGRLESFLWQECRYAHLFFVWFNQFRFGVKSAMIRFNLF